MSADQVEYVILTIHPMPGVTGAHIEQRLSATSWQIEDGVLYLRDSLAESGDEQINVAAFAAGQWVSVSEAKQKTKDMEFR